MSERIVLTQGDDGWIVESLFRGVPHNRDNCPGCDLSIMRTAIVNLVYSFMACDCDQADYAHLVERLWHPACYVEVKASHAESVADQWRALGFRRVFRLASMGITPEKARAMTDAELLRIDQVGPGKLRQIREALRGA